MFSIGLDLAYCDTNPAMRIGPIAEFGVVHFMVPGGAREVRGLRPAAAPNDRLHDFDLDRHAPRRCAAARAHTLRWGWLQRQVPKTRKSNPDDGYIPAFSKLKADIADRAWPHLLFITTGTGEKFDVYDLTASCFAST